MKFHTDKDHLCEIDEVEFWYNTQSEAPALFKLQDLVDGFEKAGYTLSFKS